MLNYLIFLREKNKIHEELLENCLNYCKKTKKTVTKCPKHCDKIIAEYFRLLSN